MCIRKSKTIFFHLKNLIKETLEKRTEHVKEQEKLVISFLYIFIENYERDSSSFDDLLKLA